MSALNNETYYGKISKLTKTFNKLNDSELGMNYIRRTNDNTKEEEQER